MNLHFDCIGAGPPLVIAHGLLGTSRNWAGAAKKLSAHHRVFLVDMRNHGASPWDDDMSYEAMGDDLHEFIQRHSLQGATVMGHSMGGKAAMALALRHPHAVRRLIVVDIAPVQYQPGFLAYVKAMRAIGLASLQRRAQVDALLSVEIPDRVLRGFLMMNLETAGGALNWRPNLPVLEENMLSIGGFPDMGHTHWLGPSLFVYGGNSEYGVPDHHAKVTGLFPNARFQAIPGAGHWVHAEQPGPFLDAVSSFLDATA